MKRSLILLLTICIIFSCKKEQPDVPAAIAVEDAFFDITVWDEDKAFNSPVLISWDNGEGIHKLVEINMDGSIAWEYEVPGNGSLTDIEYIDNGNILFVVKAEGVYEIDTNKNIVWSYLDETVWHDADRLANGNTLMTCGVVEQMGTYPNYGNKPIVKEVDPSGNVVWEWKTFEHYANTPYDTSFNNALYSSEEWRGDWTHLNGVERMENGHTMLSIRNWDLLLFVDENGNVVDQIGSGNPGSQMLNDLGNPDDPHNPVILGAGLYMISEPWKGKAIEMDQAGTVTWEWPSGGWQDYGQLLFIRDARPLPNTNVLIVDASGSLIEVTKSGEVVWECRIPGFTIHTNPISYVKSFMQFFKADKKNSGMNKGW